MGVQDGWYQFDNDINAVLAALLNEYIVSGGVVTEKGVPDMSVDVAAITYYANGQKVVKAGVTNVAIAAADGTNPRKDIIVGDSAGTLSAVAGTPAAAAPTGNTGPNTYTPIPPNIPANKVLIAEVWVQDNETTILDADITDRRVVVNKMEDAGINVVHSLAELQAVITALGAGGGSVLGAPATYSFTDDYEIPAQIHLTAVKGAIFDVANTKLLTINGTFEGDLSQHFSGAGDVVFGVGSVASVPPQWFSDTLGIIGSAAANSVSLQKCINSAVDVGSVFFLGGLYYYDSCLYYNASWVTLFGVGVKSKLIYVGAGGTMLGASALTHSNPDYTYYLHCKMNNLYLYSDDDADIGLDLSGFSYGEFHDFLVHLNGSDKKLIYGVGEQGAAPYYNHIDSFALAGSCNGVDVTGSVGIACEPGACAGDADGPNANIFTNLKRAIGLDRVFDIKAGHGNLGSNLSAETIYEAFIVFADNAAIESGTSTGGGTHNQLRDTGKAWGADIFLGDAVKITAGTGAGQTRRIKTHTATILTVFHTWTVLPDATSDYEIYPGKAVSNKFNNLRMEGAAPAVFLKAYPGCFGNVVKDYSVTSTSGVPVVDTDTDPSNNYFGQPLAEFTFMKEDIAANLTDEYIFPYKGAAFYHGGHYPYALDYVVKGITASCTGRQAGTLTITVETETSSYVVVIDGDKPYYTQIPGDLGVAEAGSSKIQCKITTDAGWLPVAADLVVSVFVYLFN